MVILIKINRIDYSEKQEAGFDHGNHRHAHAGKSKFFGSESGMTSFSLLQTSLFSKLSKKRGTRKDKFMTSLCGA
jgi:hypothetical protein